MNQNNDTTPATSPVWSTPTRRIMAVVLSSAVVVGMVMTRVVWGYLIVAVALMVLVGPIISLLQGRMHFPRWLAIVIAYLVALVLLIAALLLLPALVASFIELGAGLAYAAAEAADWIIGRLEAFEEAFMVTDSEGSVSAITDPLVHFLEQISSSSASLDAATFLSFTASVAGIAAGLLSSGIRLLLAIGMAILLTFTYSIYMTFDDGKLRRGALALISAAYRPEITGLGAELVSIWRLYIRGQLGVMFAVGSITFLVAWALGLPAPLALGVIAGLLEIIPHIGPILAAVPAVILAFFVGSSRFDIPNIAFAVVVAIAYTLIQQLEDLALTPRIQGKAIHMSPLVVMISIVVAFEYAGILGAIVAVPVTASVWLLFNYVYAKVRGHAWPDAAQAGDGNAKTAPEIHEPADDAAS